MNTWQKNVWFFSLITVPPFESIFTWSELVTWHCQHMSLCILEMCLDHTSIQICLSNQIIRGVMEMHGNWMTPEADFSVSHFSQVATVLRTQLCTTMMWFDSVACGRSEHARTHTHAQQPHISEGSRGDTSRRWFGSNHIWLRDNFTRAFFVFYFPRAKTNVAATWNGEEEKCERVLESHLSFHGRWNNQSGHDTQVNKRPVLKKYTSDKDVTKQWGLWEHADVCVGVMSLWQAVVFSSEPAVQSRRQDSANLHFPPVRFPSIQVRRDWDDSKLHHRLRWNHHWFEAVWD